METTATSQIKSMKDVMASASFSLPRAGEVVEGVVISVSKSRILIDLGMLGTGIVYPREFYDTASVQKSLSAGDKVSAILLDIENEEGFRELSLKQAHTSSAWSDIKEKKEKGEIITTKILNINKGGLIVEINSIQGFLPLSQLGPEHYPKVEGGDTSKIVQVLQKYRNQDFQVKIIDYNEQENKLIVSERAILDDKLKERIGKYEIGQTVEGEVIDVTDFGAFVKLEEGIEGLVHVSEIDWKIIDDPRDVLSVGQKVQAKIASIDGTKISLSLKALKPDPWLGIEEKFSVGQIVKGTVVKITAYGVLVKLKEDLIGIILNAEFADRKPQEAVAVGESYDMAIISIDPKEHKMLLTLHKI